MAALAVPPLVLRSAVDVCHFVDQLPHDAAGQLTLTSVGEAAAGAVFVENGRVCWAAARGLAQRLSDLLAASAQLGATDMEELYEACKERGTPLGEYLVSSGFITAPDLRNALLKHTAESLHALCEESTEARWFGRRAGAYSSRFTFRTPELLSRTCAEAHRDLAERAARELATAFEGRDWGAAFVRSPRRAAPDPIALVGASPDKVEAVLRLGRWACSSLDTTLPLHDGPTFVSTDLGDGSAVAWVFGGAVIAGRMSSSGTARLLQRRARLRREEDVSGNL